MNEKRKDRALLVLRKKKLVEKQLIQVDTLMVNIEDMVCSVLPICTYRICALVDYELAVCLPRPCRSAC